MNSASALLLTGQVRVELCLMSSDYSDLNTIACARISVNRHCKYFVPARKHFLRRSWQIAFVGGHGSRLFLGT